LARGGLRRGAAVGLSRAARRRRPPPPPVRRRGQRRSFAAAVRASAPKNIQEQWLSEDILQWGSESDAIRG